MKLFCFGFGQVAESFINKLIFEKRKFELTITSRQDTHQIKLNNLKINSYLFNNGEFDKKLSTNLLEANYILISIPPIEGKDIVLKNFKSYLVCNLQCVGYAYIFYIVSHNTVRVESEKNLPKGGTKKRKEQ